MGCSQSSDDEKKQGGLGTIEADDIIGKIKGNDGKNSSYLIIGDLLKCSKQLSELETCIASKISSEVDRPAFLLIGSFCKLDSDEINNKCDLFRLGKPGKSNSRMKQFFPSFFDNDDWISVIKEITGENEVIDALNKDDNVTAGVLGGMGPLACSEFFVSFASHLNSILSNSDRERLTLIYWSDPDFQIFSDGGQLTDILDFRDYLDARKSYKSFLECPQISALLAPSNTFHLTLYIHDENVIQVKGMKTEFMKALSLYDKNEQVPERVVSLIHSSRDHVQEKFPNQKIACLATGHTAGFKTYETLIGPNCVSDPDIDELTENAIRSVKSGDLDSAKKSLKRALSLVESKLETTLILLGCTELPLILNQNFVSEEFGDNHFTLVSTIDIGINALTARAMKLLALD